jgi:hypothetical protein
LKTIVAGSRSVSDYQVVRDAIVESEILISEVVSGTARGVDKLGENYARIHNLPIAYFPADWDIHGKKAGYLRNQKMADYAEALVAIWDGESKGTKSMIDIARKKGLRVFVKVV